MLRAAFLLAALGAADAQHDEAGRVHEHDERHHDDMRMHDPGHLIAQPHIMRIGSNLISCQWLQAMTHDQREDEEHAENARVRHGPIDAPRSDRLALQQTASPKPSANQCKLLVDGALRARRLFGRNKDEPIRTTRPRGNTILTGCHDNRRQ